MTLRTKVKTGLIDTYQFVIALGKYLSLLLRGMALWLQPTSFISQKAHVPVTVSVTSYSARLPSCFWPLVSILTQGVRPTRVVLWLTDADIDRLPERIVWLRRRGLCIHSVDRDLGPATKLIPALKAWPDQTIVTADDDAIYDSGWLEGLYAEHKRFPDQIVCYRSHLVRYLQSGECAPYRSWEIMTRVDGPHPDHFFTGVGGVLYPPNALSPEVLNEENLFELSRSNDDIWFNAMARRNNTQVRRVAGAPNRWITAFRTSGEGLYRSNVMNDANDQIVRDISSKYGSPFRMKSN